MIHVDKLPMMCKGGSTCIIKQVVSSHKHFFLRYKEHKHAQLKKITWLHTTVILRCTNHNNKSLRVKSTAERVMKIYHKIDKPLTIGLDNTHINLPISYKVSLEAHFLLLRAAIRATKHTQITKWTNHWQLDGQQTHKSPLFFTVSLELHFYSLQQYMHHNTRKHTYTLCNTPKNILHSIHKLCNCNLA